MDDGVTGETTLYLREQRLASVLDSECHGREWDSFAVAVACGSSKDTIVSRCDFSLVGGAHAADALTHLLDPEH
eukprot:834010-Rhodomonas_salina.1